MELLVSACCVSDADTIYQAVMDREREGSTGLEKGVAIPHAKCDAVERLSIVIGISKDGIEFEAQDGQPSNLFFLMVAPRTESGPHVQAIAKIVKMIKAGIVDPTKVVRYALQNAASIAGLMLTTEALINEIPEEKKEPAMPGGDMGGMGGGF